MVNRIMASKDVLVLILGTCKYVRLYGKRGFADVVKDLKWKIILNYLSESHPYQGQERDSEMFCY